MNEINLHNYEAYMLDYMEGNLSDDLTIELMAFANNHPELEIDIFDNVADLSFDAETITYSNKEGLKVHDEEVLFDKMISIVEGEYNAEEVALIETEIEKKGFAKTYAYFKATKLVPISSIKFENKKSLKVDTGKIIPLAFWKYSSVAAAAVIGLFALAYNYTNSVGVGNERVINGLALEEWKNSPATHEFKHVRGTVNSSQKEENQFIPNNDNNFAVVNDLPDEKINESDTSKSIIPKTKEVLPIEDNIVQDPPKLDTTAGFKNPLPLEDDYAFVPDAITKSTEPYSLITNAMSNVLKNDVEYVKEESIGAESNSVTRRFSIGKFSFERKISN